MKDLQGNKRSAEEDVSPTGRRARPVELRHNGQVSQRDEVGRSTRPPITQADTANPPIHKPRRHPCQHHGATSVIETMRTAPLIEITAYDICDDQDCGCETCQTPWGTEVPLKARRSGAVGPD